MKQRLLAVTAFTKKIMIKNLQGSVPTQAYWHILKNTQFTPILVFLYLFCFPVQRPYETDRETGERRDLLGQMTGQQNKPLWTVILNVFGITQTKISHRGHDGYQKWTSRPSSIKFQNFQDWIWYSRLSMCWKNGKFPQGLQELSKTCGHPVLVCDDDEIDI